MNTSIKLSELTAIELIITQHEFTDRMSVIQSLTDKLNELDRISDQQQFIDAVMKREEEAPTALGESLAVPHGKSNSVKQASFACAILPKPMLWPGLEGDESVELIFLLAIPEQEANSTHIQLLAKLTTALLDDEFRAKLLTAKDNSSVMELFESLEQTTSLPIIANSESVVPLEIKLLENDRGAVPYLAVLFSGVLISALLFFLT